MVNNKNLILKAKSAQLSIRQKDILVGLILGDGHLSSFRKGKTARLMYSQGGEGRVGDAHEKLFFSVYHEFEDWCSSSPRKLYRQSGFKKNPEKLYKSHVFTTICHSEFGAFFDRFYKLYPIAFKNPQLLTRDTDKDTFNFSQLSLLDPSFDRFYYRKVIPSQIDKMLTPISLTYWYMDDGSIKDKNSGACLLNTQDFLLSECKLLCSALYNVFGLDAQIRYKNREEMAKGHQIYISSKGTSIFKFLTREYLSDMSYKLPKRTLWHKK